jgi:hypothetical protein
MTAPTKNPQPTTSKADFIRLMLRILESLPDQQDLELYVEKKILQEELKALDIIPQP